MSKERPQKREGFGFTEHEMLWDVVHDKRFQQLMEDEKTRIHQIDLSTNTYGEFLFVTLSRSDDVAAGMITFYGLGFHEARDRWITEEWRWYTSNERYSEKAPLVPRQTALAQVAERRAEVQSYALNAHSQSKRGQLFEILAEMTDEDGALADLEDFGDDFFGDLDDE